jgi:ribosomal protein S18 acetylase RimI-like enzyme
MPESETRLEGKEAWPGGFSIRPARLTEAEALAKLMVEGLNSRLNNLGAEIVVILHRQMIASTHCLCLVAERQGTLLGYVSVLTSTRKFYREFLLRRGVRCAVIALPRLLNPANLRTALRAGAYFPGRPSNDPEAELVSLVVSPEARGARVGAALFRGAVEELRSQGVTTFKVCTGTENEAANALYRRHACKLIRSEPLYQDNRINVYIYEGV